MVLMVFRHLVLIIYVYLIEDKLLNKEAEEFITKDTEISVKQIQDIQENLNLESKQCAKILNLGKEHRQTKRIRNAMISRDIKPLDLALLIKDHKESRPDGGKPSRPGCIARHSPNSALM